MFMSHDLGYKNKNWPECGTMMIIISLIVSKIYKSCSYNYFRNQWHFVNSIIQNVLQFSMFEIGYPSISLSWIFMFWFDIYLKTSTTHFSWCLLTICDSGSKNWINFTNEHVWYKKMHGLFDSYSTCSDAHATVCNISLRPPSSFWKLKKTTAAFQSIEIAKFIFII